MKQGSHIAALHELEAQFETVAASLALYDTLTWVGYPPRSHVAWPDDAAVISRMLASSPIRRSLLSHTASWLNDPDLGNRKLAALLKELPGVYGVMTLLPEMLLSDRDVGRYIDGCVCDGMRAARILPKAHRFTLKTPGVGEFLDALAARHIPLFIPIGHTSWDEIGPLALAYPSLQIFMESAGHHEYLNMRGALPWLEKSANLLVPTNRQFLAGGLELLVERLGAHRVLFASGRPIEDPWAALGPIVMNKLSDKQRHLIAHGNLERLLNAVSTGGNA